MTPHAPGCPRGPWLVRLHREHGWSSVLLLGVLFDGPPCTCPRGGLFGAEQSRRVTPGAQVPPTGMNTEAGGASPT